MKRAVARKAAAVPHRSQIHCQGSKDSTISTSTICIKIGTEMKRKCIICDQNNGKRSCIQKELNAILAEVPHSDHNDIFKNERAASIASQSMLVHVSDRWRLENNSVLM